MIKLEELLKIKEQMIKLEKLMKIKNTIPSLGQRSLIQTFPAFTIEVIPRAKNSHADALNKLGSTEDVELLSIV